MSSFTHANDDELRFGLDFALDKYGVKLNLETLRILFNETGKLRLKIEGKHSHNQAKRAILDQHLPQSTKEERRRFTAYSAAIGKMANRRATLARRAKKPPKKLTEVEKIKGQLFLRPDGRQWAFV